MSKHASIGYEHNANTGSYPDLSRLSLSAFQYDALDHTTDAIRVLDLLPGAEDSAIQCNLRHTNTSCYGDYMCLSYTWQPEKPRQDIEVNGCVLSVGQNLFQFLKAYRRYQGTGKASPLWIDAICINQSDLVEKGHQIQRMGSIYRSSGQVLIWPGKLSWHIRRMLRAKQILPATPRIDKATPLEVLNSSIVPSNNFLNRQIAAFWSLPYWDRLWIVQEILSGGGSGERVNILLEEVLVDLVDLGRKLGKRGSMMSTSHAEFQSLSIGERFAYWRAALNGKETTPKSLEVYISEFRHKKCQKICDRVYGLMALSTDQLIEVDCQAGPINLFCHYLDSHMHRKAVDELLVLGATLIEALEISSKLAPEQVKSTKISSPVWREGELEIVEFGPDDIFQNHSYVKKMLCMFVTVRDAQDIHIFEYAVEESEVEENKVEENEVKENEVEENEVKENEVEENEDEENEVKENKDKENEDKENEDKENKVKKNKVKENEVEENKVKENEVKENENEENEVKENEDKENKDKENKDEENEDEENEDEENEVEENEVEENEVEENEVEENEVEERKVKTSVTVRYARAYEFVSGQPNGLRHRGHVAEIEKGNPHTKNDWINKPTEEILYCRNFSGQASLASPLLRRWTVADDVLELVDTSSVTPNSEKAQLSLGRRYWRPEQVLIISRPDDLEHIKFEPFMGMALYVGQELITAVDESMMFEVPQSRGTLLRDSKVRTNIAAILPSMLESES